MKLLTQVNKWWVVCALALSYQACDDVNSDVMPPQEEIDQAKDVNMRLKENSPVIIDLVRAANLTGDGTFSISRTAGKGSIELLKSALLKYTPNQDFVSGSDDAEYQVCVNGICDKGIIAFKFDTESDSCFISANYDRVEALPTDQQVVIPVLQNDSSCYEQFDVSTLNIVEHPHSGEAVATDGLIFYYPTGSYSGTAQIIYEVATKENPDIFYYGLTEVVLNDTLAEIEVHSDSIAYTYEEYLAALHPTYQSLDFNLDQILGNDELDSIPYNQLDISITGQPTHGTAAYFSLEIFRFTPGQSFNGYDSFTYQVCYNGQCSTGTVYIIVTGFGATTGLQAYDDQFTYTPAEFEQVVYNSGDGIALDLYYDNILMNDSLNGAGMFDVNAYIVNQPQHGQVIYYDRELFRYLPDQGYEFTGTDSFSYKICDNDGCSEATVTITVQ